jgi:hypothetical protein
MNSLEFESNYEENIYAKLCGHTPQACASPSKLAWTSRVAIYRNFVTFFDEDKDLFIISRTAIDRIYSSPTDADRFDQEYLEILSKPVR